MTLDRIYTEPQFAQMYDWDNPWPDDFDYFATLAEGSNRVLDIGCGTGIFSTELARRGHTVTGLDPAAAMLNIARNRSHGDQVRWVLATAQSFELDQKFDMVLMTGHAFQTLLQSADRQALMKGVFEHLVPGGRFFFDSRNPEYEAWKHWTPEETLEERNHHEFGMVKRWKDHSWNAVDKIVTYETAYQFPSGKTLSTHSQIAFPSQKEIAEHITQAGLQVEKWVGDCQGGPYRSDSPEIIPLGFKPNGVKTRKNP